MSGQLAPKFQQENNAKLLMLLSNYAWSFRSAASSNDKQRSINDLIPCTTDGGPSQLVPMALEGRGGLPRLKMPELYQVSRLNMLDEDGSIKKQTVRVLGSSNQHEGGWTTW